MATIEDYWKIVRREVTIAEAMRILGEPEEDIANFMEKLKYAPPYKAFSFMGGMVDYALSVLEKAGEIDTTRMFNMKTKIYSQNMGQVTVRPRSESIRKKAWVAGWYGKPCSAA